ncbi:MAG: choice-of-anchor D domain-containing protein, partial [Verrucomicrobiaceae bacterium]
LQTRLLATNPDQEDHFGYAAAIEGDAVVFGAIGEKSNATGVNGDQTNNSVSNAGAAYAFTRFGTTWTPQAYLKAAKPHVEDLFGAAVGISGGTVVAGSPNESRRGNDAAGNESTEPATYSGIVYVFGPPTASPGPEISLLRNKNLTQGDTDDLGAVAVGASGRPVRFFINNSGTASLTGLGLAIKGANAADFSLTSLPAATVARNGNTYFDLTFTPGATGLREAVLQCFSNDDDESPLEIRLTGTGTSDAPLTRALGAWLKASGVDAGDNFGQAVAVDGDTVVVGAPNENSNATGVNGNDKDNSAPYAGAAYVFVRQNGGWVQQAYLKSLNSVTRNFFGNAVAICGDTIVVGAMHEATGGYDSGAAFVFVRNGTTWTEQA